MPLLTKLIYALLGCAGVVFVLGFLADCKIVPLDMLGLLQITYFGALLSAYTSPLRGVLSLLKYSNGYNLPTDPSSLPHLSSLEYSSSISGNLNVILSLVGLPILLACLSLIASKIFEGSRRMFESMFRTLIGEYTIWAICICLCNFSVSLGATIWYRNIKSMELVWTLVEGLLFLGVLGASVSLFLLKDFVYFGEFKYTFKITDKYSQYYYLVPML